MRTYAAVAIALAVCIGCESKESNPIPFDLRAWLAGDTQGGSVLIRIPTMPKADALQQVEASDNFTNAEKAAIADRISIDTYTHCSLEKIEFNNRLLIVVNQVYPLHVIDTDPDEPKEYEGGSGHVFVIDDTPGVSNVQSIFYD